MIGVGVMVDGRATRSSLAAGCDVIADVTDNARFAR
jgi:hypothetical protein